MTDEDRLLFVLERTKSNKQAQEELIRGFIAEKGSLSEETARKVKVILKGE